MNDQHQSPISFQTRFMATLKGELLGSEPVIALFGFFFLTIAVVTLILDSLNPSGWLKIIGGSSFLCIISLFFYWMMHDDRHKGNMPRTTLTTEDFSLTTHLTDPTQAKLTIELLIAVLKNRKPLVPPYGEVTGGDPKSKKGLRMYSPEERDKLTAEIHAATATSDEVIVRELDAIAESLKDVLPPENQL